ncbi:MAG: Ribosomal RNA small subunit methyltransferase E [Spirochaetes bacterium ADurb.Bin110]|jgi:RsmE family RNA methyltransferase|nr:MAG: Ribosomal RNA small subunit methyltransferase E [Spirochaetes bacterium ADurb.Bin110]
MNILILDSSSETQFLSLKDRRTQHILEVLKKEVGGRMRAGSLDGLVGWAILESVGDAEIMLRFMTEGSAPPLRPLRVLIGTARPIQAARIVRELSILGVESIVFVPTELGEKSYTQSHFYQQKEYLTYAREGAEQAGNPRLPEISLAWTLDRALMKAERTESMDHADTESPVSAWETNNSKCTRLLCHPDLSAQLLGDIILSGLPIVLAIGTERGWTKHEIDIFLNADYLPCSLGDRILKTETAASAAVSILLSRLGYM